MFHAGLQWWHRWHGLTWEAGNRVAVASDAAANASFLGLQNYIACSANEALEFELQQDNDAHLTVAAAGRGRQKRLLDTLRCCNCCIGGLQWSIV